MPRAVAADEAERAEVRVRARPQVELPEDPSSFSEVIDVSGPRGEAESTERVLSRAVGVQVRRFGGPGQQSEVSIRGSSGRQVVVLLDGLRLNSPVTGSADLSTVPLALLERVEVARGGASVQAGSGALGGVVNLVPRRPKEDPETRVSLSGGSFGTWEGAVSHTRRGPEGRGLSIGYQGFATDGDFDFQTVEVESAVGVTKSREIERINNDAESHSGLLRLSREGEGGQEWVWTTHGLFLSRGLPGLDLRQSPGARERRFRVLSDLTWSDADVLEGRATVSLRAAHRLERTRFHDDRPPPPRTPFEQLLWTHESTLRASGELALENGPAEHLFTGWGELRREALRGDDVGGARQRFLGGIALQDEIALFAGRLRLVPGARFDHTEDEGSRVVPRVGAVADLLPWLRLRANWEESYRVPSFDERFFDQGSLRGDPNLKPEEAWSWDVGLEVGLGAWGPMRSFRVEAAYFESDIDESIVFQQVSPDTVAATNTGPADIRGVEVSASVSLWDWLRLSGNYTRQDTDRRGGRGGLIGGGGQRPLPGRAPEEWSLRGEFGPPSGLYTLRAEGSYVGEIPVTASGARLEDRTTLDVSASLDLARWWPTPWLGPRPEQALVSLTVVNATDQSVRDALSFPQPGRSVTLRGEVAW